MPASWADLEPAEAAGRVRIGIETDRGTWVQALLTAGYQVFAINPMSVARYRERHSTSGAKSDVGDAHVLAEIVRLDHARHRQVAGDSALPRGSRETGGPRPSEPDPGPHPAKLPGSRSSPRGAGPAAATSTAEPPRSSRH